MRTSLFLSTLFAVSLLGGAALAEKPNTAEKILRTHGDTVDKSYKSERAAAPVSHDAGVNAQRQATATRSPLASHGSSRMNCSDTGQDCSSSRASRGTASQPAASAPSSASASHAKNPLEKQSDTRVNCNEGDECSASSKGTKALWSKGHGASDGSNHTSINPSQDPAASSRSLAQAGSDRMACNEGDECSFSSKAAHKIWRTEAFKHGTVDGTKPGNNFTDAHLAMKEAWKGKAFAPKESRESHSNNGAVDSSASSTGAAQAHQ